MWPGSEKEPNVTVGLSSDTEENLNSEKNDDDEARRREAAKARSISNQKILAFTCTAFFLFVVAEFVGAVVSGSLSLLGDAAAMSVDVFTVSASHHCSNRTLFIKYEIFSMHDFSNVLPLITQYLCNIYAERYKMRGEIMSRRTNIMLEVMIPSFSVVCLLGVTVYVAVDAVSVVMAGAANTKGVDLFFLYGYSAAGAVIDIASSIIFFKDRTGTAVFYTNGASVLKVTTASALHNEIADETRVVESGQMEVSAPTSRKVNLNMMSAFTHLSADSMRTAAVIIAAMISSFGNYPSQICDAYAALVITVMIVIMTIPLIREIYKAHSKLMEEPDIVA